MGVVVSYLKLGANSRSAILWTALDCVLSSPGVHSLKKIIHKIQPEGNRSMWTNDLTENYIHTVHTHTHTCSLWVSWEHHLWKCLCSSLGFLWHHTQPGDKKQDVNLIHDTCKADDDHIFVSFSNLYHNTWCMQCTTGEETTKFIFLFPN